MNSALRTISSKDFLRRAWTEIRKRNVRSKGVDQVTIQAFKSRLDENLDRISDELRSGTYAFNPLRAHVIDKPGSSRPRPLQIASVRDRVVMKALALYIEPEFSKFDLSCSFAFIKGRGVKNATLRIKELLSLGNKFYFQADIIDFFGSVDRSQLWNMFSARVRHKSLLPLLHKCFELEIEDLQSYETEFQQLFLGADSGIPQGGVLSPMLANFYLHYFDRKMTDRGFHLVRYADDLVVMCESEHRAREAYDFSRITLQALSLKIHDINAKDSKTRIGYFPKDGLTFLGVRFEGDAVYPSAKAVKRFRSKVEEVLDPKTGTNLFKTLQKLANLIQGWGKCYRSMRVLTVYSELDGFVNCAVEAYLQTVGIQLLGKKRRKHMKLLGIPSLVSMVEYQGHARSATVAGH